MRLQAISPSEELLALQRAAYAVEAELLGDDRIPALAEDLAALSAAGLTWLGAVSSSGRLVGAVAYVESSSLVDVHRLVVAPASHRRGVGRKLVSAVLVAAGDRRVVVATGHGNAPARSLYEQLGFRHVEDVEVLPGLVAARYERP